MKPSWKERALKAEAELEAMRKKSIDESARMLEEWSRNREYMKTIQERDDQ